MIVHVLMGWTWSTGLLLSKKNIFFYCKNTHNQYFFFFFFGGGGGNHGETWNKMTDNLYTCIHASQVDSVIESLHNVMQL